MRTGVQRSSEPLRSRHFCAEAAIIFKHHSQQTHPYHICDAERCHTYKLKAMMDELIDNNMAAQPHNSRECHERMKHDFQWSSCGIIKCVPRYTRPSPEQRYQRATPRLVIMNTYTTQVLFVCDSIHPASSDDSPHRIYLCLVAVFSATHLLIKRAILGHITASCLGSKTTSPECNRDQLPQAAHSFADRRFSLCRSRKAACIRRQSGLCWRDLIARSALDSIEIAARHPQQDHRGAKTGQGPAM
jgi:hypothetical protein